MRLNWCFSNRQIRPDKYDKNTKIPEKSEIPSRADIITLHENVKHNITEIPENSHHSVKFILLKENNRSIIELSWFDSIIRFINKRNCLSGDPCCYWWWWPSYYSYFFFGVLSQESVQNQLPPGKIRRKSKGRGSTCRKDPEWVKKIFQKYFAAQQMLTPNLEVWDRERPHRRCAALLLS